MVETSIYDSLSEERKELQSRGLLPGWFTTGGWQLFKSKYLYEAEGIKDTFERIATTASKHTPNPEMWAPKFFDIMWNGWLAPSTPVISNMGTPKGMPVSCSGQMVGDSIDDFYKNYRETALLTKHGFGTSANLSNVRPRGHEISSGGRASGVLPVIKHFIQDMRDVAQGNSRRGAWAGYLDILHDDYWEVANYLERYPDDLNIGWVISDKFIESLEVGDEESLARFQRSLKVRSTTGKGYYLFSDKANKLSPDMYKDLGLVVDASNLCTEISLYSNEEETFTCVLSSMNLSKYDEWKNTDAVFTATVFLDCVAQEFIEEGSKVSGLGKAVRFTDKNRALGLGALGFHTYLQKNMIPIESFEAHMKNIDIFQNINDRALEASRWMAKEWGEPDNCLGYGVRNTHVMAVAPNTSSALLCGGVSQGIEPVVANVYNQPSSAGEISRINPVFMEYARVKGCWNEELVLDIDEHQGSVQHLGWMSDEDKLVFKTAYEVDQKALVRLAAARQPYICQGQSINLFFDADEDEGYIAEVHKEAFLNPMIKSLYYMRGQAGVLASKGECLACEG